MIFEFQSLFYWTDHATMEVLDLKADMTGFNPCFTGPIMQLLDHLDWHVSYTIVSILVLLDRSCNSYETMAKGTNQQVSILVLLDRSCNLLEINLDYIIESGFNPCFTGPIMQLLDEKDLREGLKFQSLFYWTDHATGNEWTKQVNGVSVSILVLLDRSCNCVAGDWHRYYQSVSILVLLDRSCNPDDALNRH